MIRTNLYQCNSIQREVMCTREHAFPWFRGCLKKLMPLFVRPFHPFEQNPLLEKKREKHYFGWWGEILSEYVLRYALLYNTKLQRDIFSNFSMFFGPDLVIFRQVCYVTNRVLRLSGYTFKYTWKGWVTYHSKH